MPDVPCPMCKGTGNMFVADIPTAAPWEILDNLEAIYDEAIESKPDVNKGVEWFILAKRLLTDMTKTSRDYPGWKTDAVPRFTEVMDYIAEKHLEMDLSELLEEN